MRSFGILGKVDLSPHLSLQNIRTIPGQLRAGPKPQHPGLGFAIPSFTGGGPRHSSVMLPAPQQMKRPCTAVRSTREANLGGEQTRLLLLSPLAGAAPRAHLVDHDEAFGVDADATLLEKARCRDGACGRGQGLLVW